MRAAPSNSITIVALVVLPLRLFVTHRGAAPMIVRGTLLTFFAALALPVAVAFQGGAEEVPAGGDSFAALFAEYGAAEKRYFEELKAARGAAKKKGDEALEAFRFDKPPPDFAFSRRFLAIAEANPEGPDAVDALA
jgi:hypothetical protein